MNSKPEDYSPLEVKADLDTLVKYMLADVTDRVLGPVVEHDYYINVDMTHYGVLYKAGVHRVTTQNGYAIAYQGPGEEG
jgi:hypothetical protein